MGPEFGAVDDLALDTGVLGQRFLRPATADACLPQSVAEVDPALVRKRILFGHDPNVGRPGTVAPHQTWCNPSAWPVVMDAMARLVGETTMEGMVHMRSVRASVGAICSVSLMLAACGGESEEGGASPTTSAAAAGSGTSPTAKSTKDPAVPKSVADQVKPPPGYTAPVWHDKGEFVTATDKVVVVTSGDVENATKLRGLDAQTGREIWRLDLTRPPGAKLRGEETPDSMEPPSVRSAVIGSSVAAEWVGYSGDDALKKPRLRHLFAAFDLNTGKQRGKTAEPTDGPSQTLSGGPDGPLAYWLFKDSKGQDGRAKDTRMMFADGTVSAGKSPKTPGDPQDTSSWIVLLSPSDAVLAQSTDQTAFHDGEASWTLQSARDRKLVGPKSTCTMVANSDTTEYGTSPNGEWMSWDKAVVSTTEPGKVTCLTALSEHPVTVQAVTNDGGAYATSNGQALYVKPGSAKAQVLGKEGETSLPLAALDKGAVFSAGGPQVGDEGIVFYRR